MSVKALVLDEERTRFLIVKEENGKWELPGGGLDWGEDPHAGLRREIKEEMGIEVVWISERPCYFLSRKADTSDIWVANVLYETRLKNLEFEASDECVELRFVEPSEINDLNTFSNVKMLAEQFDPKNHRT